MPIVMRKRFTKATLNFTTCLGFGIMMCSSDYAIFTNDSAQKLLRDKFVLIMGDSGKPSALHSNQVQTETLKLRTTKSKPKSTVACTVACRGLWWLGPGQLLDCSLCPYQIPVECIEECEKYRHLEYVKLVLTKK